jgi:hypothetical protein
VLDDVRHVVGDEDDGLGLLPELGQLVQALRLEGRVAHREDLVDEKDVRVDVGGHREAEPDGHSGRVILDGCVDEALDLGEGHDAVELVLHLGAAHPHDGPVEVHVLAAGEVEVEARAHLDEGSDPSNRRERAPGGHGYPGQDLQGRALARPVGADESHRFAALDGEAHVAQGPEEVGGGPVAGLHPAAETADGLPERREVPTSAEPVALGYLVEGEDDVAHGAVLRSRPRRFVRRA